jgi:hypothetical protein|tara:strand:- start:49 stop:585 length:537 start_codon:yes stop_codon:yes gene_type:complete
MEDKYDQIFDEIHADIEKKQNEAIKRADSESKLIREHLSKRDIIFDQIFVDLNQDLIKIKKKINQISNLIVIKLNDDKLKTEYGMTLIDIEANIKDNDFFAPAEKYYFSYNISIEFNKYYHEIDIDYSKKETDIILVENFKQIIKEKYNGKKSLERCFRQICSAFLKKRIEFLKHDIY